MNSVCEINVKPKENKDERLKEKPWHTNRDLSQDYGSMNKISCSFLGYQVKYAVGEWKVQKVNHFRSLNKQDFQN